jgi:cell division protease FtsH
MKMEEYTDHSKALIFVCGNIDEAFAGLTDELDSDLMTPDEFYEESSLINSADIKECLLLRFRAEQVARLGSQHVVFPSFNNKMYEGLIDKLNKKAISDFKEQCGQTLVLDNSIKEFLMQNCAIPSQGARSILSSHGYLINSNIPEAVMLHILHGAKVIKIEVKDLQVITYSGKNKVVREIDIVDKRVHSNYTEPLATLVAGHEAGHAICNFAFYGAHPLLIKTRNSDSSVGGYCKSEPQTLPKKREMINRIAMAMGGIAAEMLASGEDGFSAGGSSDIQQATAIATQMQRSYGMGNHMGNSGLSQTQITLSYNKKEDEIMAENLVEEGLLLALTALIFYKKEHKLLTDALKKKTIMRTAEIAKVTGLK